MSMSMAQLVVCVVVTRVVSSVHGVEDAHARVRAPLNIEVRELFTQHMVLPHERRQHGPTSATHQRDIALKRSSSTAVLWWPSIKVSSSTATKTGSGMRRRFY